MTWTTPTLSCSACCDPAEVTCTFFFQAEDGIRDYKVNGVQTCALPIFRGCIGHYAPSSPGPAGWAQPSKDQHESAPAMVTVVIRSKKPARTPCPRPLAAGRTPRGVAHDAPVFP